MTGKTPAGVRAAIARMEAAEPFSRPRSRAARFGLDDEAAGVEPVWHAIDVIADKLVERGQVSDAHALFPHAALRQAALHAMRRAARLAEGPPDEKRKELLAEAGFPVNLSEERKLRRDFQLDLARKADKAIAGLEAVLAEFRCIADVTTDPHAAAEMETKIAALEAAQAVLRDTADRKPASLAPNADDFFGVLVSDLRLAWRKVTGAEPSVTRAVSARGCLFADYVTAIYASLPGGSRKGDLRRFIAEIGTKEGWAKNALNWNISTE